MLLNWTITGRKKFQSSPVGSFFFNANVSIQAKYAFVLLVPRV